MIIENKFINVNDYRWLKRYLAFIERFEMQDNKLNEYTHKHHILPKSIYPEYINFSQNKWNMAILSYRAHYLAHYMLAKALGGKMWAAISFMKPKNNSPHNSIIYEASLRELADTKKGQLCVFDLDKNHFWVSTTDDRIGKTLFPNRTGAIISKNQIEKQNKTMNMIAKNGKTKRQNGYTKRNEILIKKDVNFLAEIGKKSSITQKKNGKNLGRNNPNFKNKKILLLNEKGEIVHSFYHFEVSDLPENLPKRMIDWCLYNKKPMYTCNKPPNKYKECRLWYACYEDEIYTDMHVTIKNVYSKKKNIDIYYLIYDANNIEKYKVKNKELKAFCKIHNFRLNQFQYSYRNNKQISQGPQKGWKVKKTTKEQNDK